MGTLLGMVLISFLLSIPDLRYAMDMTRKGHGSVAINNSFSAQTLTLSVGFGLPTMIYAFRQHNMCHIPAHLLVTEATLFLSIGVIVFIGLTVVPALIQKKDKCSLDDLRGKILLALTLILIAIYIVLSFKKY